MIGEWLWDHGWMVLMPAGFLLLWWIGRKEDEGAGLVDTTDEPEPGGSGDGDEQYVDFDGFERSTARELYDALKIQRGLRHGLEKTAVELQERIRELEIDQDPARYVCVCDVSVDIRRLSEGSVTFDFRLFNGTSDEVAFTRQTLRGMAYEPTTTALPPARLEPYEDGKIQSGNEGLIKFVQPVPESVADDLRERLDVGDFFRAFTWDAYTVTFAHRGVENRLDIPIGVNLSVGVRVGRIVSVALSNSVGFGGSLG